MNSESANTQSFLAAVSAIPNLTVFRNNCGSYIDARGIPVFYGIGGPTASNRKGLGGSDFIGIYNGLFCAFELKSDKRKGDKARIARQENFLRQVNQRGGRAGFVIRPEDVQKILDGNGCVSLADYQF